MQSNNIYEIYLLYFMYLNLFLAIWKHLLELDVHVWEDVGFEGNSQLNQNEKEVINDP